MITIEQALEIAEDYDCDDLGTFVDAVNAEHGTRFDEEDLASLWKQTKAEIEGEDPDLPDDTR
jgi:hypothetical protein